MFKSNFECTQMLSFNETHCRQSKTYLIFPVLQPRMLKIDRFGMALTCFETGFCKSACLETCLLEMSLFWDKFVEGKPFFYTYSASLKMCLFWNLLVRDNFVLTSCFLCACFEMYFFVKSSLYFEADFLNKSLFWSSHIQGCFEAHKRWVYCKMCLVVMEIVVLLFFLPRIWSW